MALIIGHSHINCLYKAAVEHGLELNCLNLWGVGVPILREGDRPARLLTEIVDRLEPTVVSLIGGAAHDLIGLLQHPTPFDFVLPEAPDLPLIDGAAILPYLAVLATINSLIGPDEAELPGIIAATGRRVVHAESPPPAINANRLANDLPFVAALWKREAETGFRPSSPWLRYKLWRAHSALVQQRCEMYGVEFLPVPTEALVQGAFLAPELYADPLHANEAYGTLVLRQLGILP